MIFVTCHGEFSLAIEASLNVLTRGTRPPLFKSKTEVEIGLSDVASVAMVWLEMSAIRRLKRASSFGVGATTSSSRFAPKSLNELQLIKFRTIHRDR